MTPIETAGAIFLVVAAGISILEGIAWVRGFLRGLGRW